jgi:hypothetical protein
MIHMLPFAAALAGALPAGTAPPTPRSALHGTWKTGCMPIGRNGRHGFITTLTIARGKLVAVSQVYAHANCDTPTVRTSYRATIAAIRENGPTVDLDHVVDAVEMTANAADVVEAYNKPGSGCGFGGGWRLDVPRGIEGRTCAPFTFPAAGTRLYERVWIEGDKLRLGSFPTVWANTAPERRPTRPGGLAFERTAG